MSACFAQAFSALTRFVARRSFVKVLYGSRPADAVLSTRKHNDLLVFEQQARSPALRRSLLC